MTERTPALRISLPLLFLLLGGLAIAGCSGDRFAGDPGLTGPAARPAAPPVSMAGRWILAQPGRGQCNMNFGGAAAGGTAEGSIAPEGGCPGQFFTSRKWSYDSNGLTISDHNAEPLAQLSAAGGRFSGQSKGGEPITLSR
jgi:hypothetical protein